MRNRYNPNMANKGRAFEEEVKLANIAYKRKGIAMIQKISTPWQVVRDGKNIITAFPEGKSTLDFRGTISRGISISFDCKESEDARGLPLKHIQLHQIEYIKEAMEVGEIVFILCYMKQYNERNLILGETVIEYWDTWQRNKRKRGYNYIAKEDMKEISSSIGIPIDYIHGLKELGVI